MVLVTAAQLHDIGKHYSAPRFDYVELEVLKEVDRIVNRLEGD